MKCPNTNILCPNVDDLQYQLLSHLDEITHCRRYFNKPEIHLWETGRQRSSVLNEIELRQTRSRSRLIVNTDKQIR